MIYLSTNNDEVLDQYIQLSFLKLNWFYVAHINIKNLNIKWWRLPTKLQELELDSCKDLEKLPFFIEKFIKIEGASFANLH